MIRATIAVLWRPLALGAAFAAALAVAPACSKTRASTPAEKPSAAADSTVVATVHGKPITRAELDARAAGALERLRSEEYETRRSTLEEMVLDRILDAEATQRGVSRDDLLKHEVQAKVVRPTPEEIKAFYEKNRPRMGGRTLEQVAADIEVSMLRQRSNDAAEGFMADLRRKANVKVTLEQPRATIAFPADAPVLGPKDAPITIVEYSDYLCPYCQTAQATVDEVMAKYKGKVRLVHRDFPIGRPRSLATARAALCAGDQGKFWEYRQDLMVQPGDWSDSEFATRAQRLAMNVDTFKTCLASDRHDARIKASSEEGQHLGVNATPTFFVNGRRMQGVKSVEQFKEMIDSELGS